MSSSCTSSTAAFSAGLALIAIGNSLAAESDQRAKVDAKQELQDIIHTETVSVARIIAKRQLFREAAAEMTEEITARLSKGLTSDLIDIRVHKGLFSIFKSSVPHDVREEAKAGGQMLLNDLVQRTLSSSDLNLIEIGRAGITKTKYEPHFTSGRGAEFVENLDDTEIRSVARLGVINSLQSALTTVYHETVTHNPGESIQDFYATRYAFEHAMEKAVSICKEIKDPDQRIVIANNPQPVVA